ncbi:MAG: hypothetical protein CMM99_00625 [Rickettsiales bacterium]|nr:hypothetical protein [Rickettsiales bacterium]|tara:strand:+ start:428 stop:1705 length:1278 start_codon:yes stop_codon:yes gene_type:complete
MAKSDKVKQLNKIEVNSSEVIINDLVIENEDLSQYIASSENKEQALIEVISLGVQTLNTLKNSIEKDYTKKVFKDMSESMDKTLDTTLTSIQDEFNNYFDDEDGTFIKELNDSSSELSKTLKEEFENFLDPSKTESAITKIKEVLTEAKEQSKLSFEEALNPSVESSKIYELKTQLVDSFNNKIDEISTQVSDLTTALGIEEKTAELKEKSTQKGLEFEEVVQTKLVELAPNDFVSRVSKEKGSVAKSDKGDHVLTISQGNENEVNIVFESKSGNDFDSTSKIKKYLDEAMKNRDSEVGVMVFDEISRYKELSANPFFIIDENKLAVYLDKENSVDDTAFRVCYVYARQLALKISKTNVTSNEVDLSMLHDELNDILTEINNLRAIKMANTEAKGQIDKSTQLLEGKQTKIKKSLEKLFTELESS